VLVLGQGPVGQFAARIARAQGAWVAVSDRVASRLERSVADLRVDVTTDSLVAAVQQPVDTIIEATGSMAALSDALPLLANDGTIILLGYYDELCLPYMPLFLKQARLLTAKEWATGDLQRSRDLLASGMLDAAALITHRAPVARFEEAYATALNDPECLKLVIEWNVGG
jgi:3-hydroxyethyl bacteriochlorophyllide a dehydrogenase